MYSYLFFYMCVCVKLSSTTQHIYKYNLSKAYEFVRNSCMRLMQRTYTRQSEQVYLLIWHTFTCVYAASVCSVCGVHLNYARASDVVIASNNNNAHKKTVGKVGMNYKWWRIFDNISDRIVYILFCPCPKRNRIFLYLSRYTFLLLLLT